VPIGLNFFWPDADIAPQVRINLFKEIHEIVFHGKGGYDYYTIYNMPIWLRRYTFSEINKFYKKESKSYEDAKTGKNQKTMISSDGKVNTPEFAKGI
jgi:hypothetical protein